MIALLVVALVISVGANVAQALHAKDLQQLVFDYRDTTTRAIATAKAWRDYRSGTDIFKETA